MEETNILAESIIKIENVKEEPIDIEEEYDWNFSDQDESVLCSAEIENNAEEELQPPLAVFVEPIEKHQTTIFEEKDPLAPSFESVFVASIKQENDLYSSGGGSFSPWGSSKMQQTCRERKDVVLFRTQNRNFSSYHEALAHKHTCQVAIPFQDPKSSAGRKFLHLHLVTRTSVKPYQCARCKVRFSLRSSIILHLKKHLCTKICAKPDLQRRMLNRRQTRIKDLLIDSTWKKSLRRNENLNPYKFTQRGITLCYCSICLKSFNQKEQLHKHMHIHYDEKRFQSNTGGKSYTEKGNLLKLMRIHSAEDIFECTICNKCFTGKARLYNHMRIHTGDKPFQCSCCEKSFTEKSYLRVHMRVHTGEKPFKCIVCEKSFSQKTVLDIHMRIHTGEKPFQCTFCEKRFTVKGNLHTHMSIHTGDKPFRCTICKKTFTEKSYLHVHMRVHTGERPFKCSVCEKCFTQKPALNTHMRVHTGEKPFQCTICGRPFSIKGNLSTHMRIHTGEKPFPCSICEKKFSEKRSLVNHMRLHTIEKPSV